jgi:hypothetical protein
MDSMRADRIHPYSAYRSSPAAARLRFAIFAPRAIEFAF